MFNEMMVDAKIGCINQLKSDGAVLMYIKSNPSTFVIRLDNDETYVGLSKEMFETYGDDSCDIWQNHLSKSLKHFLGDGIGVTTLLDLLGVPYEHV